MIHYGFILKFVNMSFIILIPFAFFPITSLIFLGKVQLQCCDTSETTCPCVRWQVVHLCLECEKTSTLLQVLDFVPSQAQKTLIFTCSVAEAETVCKVSLPSHWDISTIGGSQSREREGDAVS